MTLFQIIVLIFIGVVFFKILKKYQEKIIGSREMFFWSLLWLSTALFIILPGTSSFLASQLGIGRGVDLVIYLALFLNFYLIFRLVIKIEKQEKNLTELVRKIALKEELTGRAGSLDSLKNVKSEPGKRE